MLIDRKCGFCGVIYIDLIEKIEDAKVKICDSCKREELVRVISAPNFFIKGANAANGYSDNAGH